MKESSSFNKESVDSVITDEDFDVPGSKELKHADNKVLTIIEVMKLPVGAVVDVVDPKGGILLPSVRIGLGENGKVLTLPNGYELDLNFSTIEYSFLVTTDKDSVNNE